MCKDFGVKQALNWGSSEPIGDYHCSLQILETGLFDGFKIGIAGHPEGPLIYRINLEKAMNDKKPFADYIVTQWLLDPEPINKFISKQSLPVHVGITGPLKLTSLIKFANIVGAKNSLNFIKSNASKAVNLIKPSDPNDLIEQVKKSTAYFHIYTFGGLKETNKWLVKNNYAKKVPNSYKVEKVNYDKVKHETSVDQSDRQVPYNLRQSGPTKVEMLISTK